MDVQERTEPEVECVLAIGRISLGELRYVWFGVPANQRVEGTSSFEGARCRYEATAVNWHVASRALRCEIEGVTYVAAADPSIESRVEVAGAGDFVAFVDCPSPD